MKYQIARSTRGGKVYWLARSNGAVIGRADTVEELKAMVGGEPEPETEPEPEKPKKKRTLRKKSSG